jgi:4'-phosphopantetheinyl transferase
MDRRTSWIPPRGTPVLTANEIHVWCAHLEVSQAEFARFLNTLSRDELARAERFRFPADRRRFVAAHGVLRETLARYLHRSPASLQFSSGPSGKPALSRMIDAHGWRFNLSHSGEVALIAVALGREIGVDIEFIRLDFDWADIADTSFSARELDVLRSLPQRSQREAFFDCWTRKEAYLKARGEGLSGPLNQIDVLLDFGESGAGLPWTIESLETVPGYAAALAAQGHGWRVRCWRKGSGFTAGPSRPLLRPSRTSSPSPRR